MSGKRVAVFFLLLLGLMMFVLAASPSPSPVLATPTYYRGYNFESYDYLNGTHRTIFGLPEWVWNGSAYVPYIFNPSAKAKNSNDDCFLVRTGLITAEIFKGYAQAKFWDVNYTEVRLYVEQWTVEYYKGNQWKDTGVGAQTPTYTYVANSSGVYITRMQSLVGVGQLNVTYAFHVGGPLKHTVVYKNLGSSTYEFRVKQSWSGIVGDRVKYQSGSVTGEYIIASAVTVNSLWFEFRKADEALSVFEDQWNTGQVINGVYRNYVLQPTVIDVHAQGMKADFLFQNSTFYTLSQGKTLKLDPTTYTFQPPTADAYINDAGDASGTSTMLVVQSMYQESSSNNYRSLLKFDMSGQIVSGSVVTSATLSLYDYQNTGARTYWVYRITQTDWTETGVTWVNRYSGAPWTTAGGTYTTTNGSSASISSSTGWKTWTVTDQVQYAVNYVSKVAHFLVKDETENNEPAVYHYFYSKEYSDTTLRPKLDVTWTPPNTAPTNDALTLDLTGASYKGTKTLLAGKQGYKFIHQVTDADGVNDINYAEIRLDYASKNVILRATRTGTDTWSMAEQSDPSDYVTVTSTSHSTSGNQKTFNWWVQINWNWDDASETLGVRAYVIDSASASDQDDYTNVFGVENDLSASGLSVNDYRCNPSQTLTFSGYWYYDGTSIPPPDGNYAVVVKLSGVQKGSTDTTLVSGAFSISDVTAESTVGSYSYTVEATYMASAGSFSAVIVDQVKVNSYSRSDDRADINANVNIDATLVYAYDSTAVTDGSVTINGYSATHQGSGVWRITRTSSTVTSVTYNTVAASGNTYGITSVNQNGQSTTVIWDRIKITGMGNDDGRRDVGTTGTFWTTAVLEYDNHALGSGDSLTINGIAMTWVAGNSRFEATDSKSTVQAATYNTFTSGNEATYGITAGNMNGYSTTIIWDVFNLKAVKVADTRVDVGSNVDLWFKVYRAYDDAVFSAGTVYVNGTAATWDAAQGAWKATVSQSSVTGKVYAVSAISDTEYGITTVNSMMSFDGSNDYVEVPHSTSLNPDHFTIEAWIRGKVFQDREPTVIQKGATFAYPGYAITIFGGGHVRFNIGRTSGESIIDSQAVLATNTWYHITVIYDGVQKIYINGVKDPAEATPPSYEKSTEPLWIGWDKRMQTASFAWDDTIDEARIYNRALSASEVEEHYRGVYSNETGLVLYLSGKMSGSTLYDESGQGNHGTIYGAVPDATARPSAKTVWDRIKITGMGNDDGRRDVGTTGTFWATAVLEYDSHALGSGDSLTISGFTMTWSTTNSRFEATDSKSTVQAATYDTFTSGNEATYGITAGNMNGYSTTIIWDRFEFVSITVDDSRINVGGTFELRYQIRYDYDDVVFDNSKGSVAGFTWDSVNNWWDKTVTGSNSVTSTNYDETYISITDSTYGLTVKQDVEGVNVITDRIEIYYEVLDDSRVDINANIEFRVRARLDYDDHALGSGDSITANFGALTWDATNSWFDGTRTQATVGSYVFTVSSGSEATYGITAVWINTSDPTGIYDRLEIVSVAFDDSRINVGGTAEVRYVLRYDYDDVQFDSGKGSVTGFTWDSVNLWWDKTVTGSSSVGSENYDETDISFTDSTYGLTAIQDVAGANLITDRIRIDSLGVVDGRIDVNSQGTWYATASLAYDSHALGSGDSLSLGGYTFTWVAGNNRFEATDTKATVQQVTVNSFSSGTESTYGITVGDINGQSGSIIWDRMKVTGYSRSDDRTDVGTVVNIDATVIYEYDSAQCTAGTLTINGISATHLGSGVYRIQPSQSSPQSVTYNTVAGSETTYGLSAVNQNGQSTSVVWDRMILSAKGVDDDRRDMGTQGVAWFKIRSEYDGTFMASGSVTINGTIAASYNAGTARWEITRTKASVQKEAYYPASVNWDVYGITALTSASGNTTSIIWDRIRIDSLGVVDGRIDINTQGTFYATASLEYDGHALGSGDSLSLGGYSFSWVAGNSRFEYSTAKPSVQALTIASYTSGSEATYGITAGNINGKSGAIIWDRVKVTDKGVTDDRANVNSYEQYWFKLASEYDDSAVEAGSVTLNGTLPMNWVADRSRWEYNVTKSSAQKLTLYPASVSWSTYGITALSDQSSNTTSIIWDGLKVDIYSIDVVSSKVYAHMKYSYDDAQVSGGNMSLAGRQASTNSTGWAAFDMSTGADFSWSPTAYGVQDASYGITYKAQNQTLPIAKKTLFIQSDANASSLSWDGEKLTVGFTAPAGSYTMKVSGTRPTYVMGTAYDLSSYTTYLTLSHDGSKNITVSYATWGDFYVRSLSQGWMTDIYWTGQTLTFVLNGTSGTTGTLTVYCGSRGLPNAITGLSGTEYSTVTKTLSGIYQFASATTVTLDWTASASASSGGGLVSTVSLFISTATLKAQQGQSVDAALEFNWTGVNQITVTGVRFQGPSGWIALGEGLPKTVTKQVGETQGKGSVAIRLIVPTDAKQGDYSIPVEVDAEALGGRVTANGWVNFAVGQQLAGPVSDLMTYVFAAMLLVLVVWAYFRR